MPSPFLDNPLVRYLEEEAPEAIVRAGLPVGASLGMQQFAQQYAPLAISGYQGEIGRRTLANEPIDLMFTDWWRSNVGAPWASREGMTPMPSSPYRLSGMERQRRGTQRLYRRYGTGRGLSGPIRRAY